MTSPSTRATRTTGTVWAFLFALALIRCWLMPMRSGFWLDETGTYYIISGSWHQFLERMSVTIQSPLYCAMMWLVYHGLGPSEWILRAPSILAMGLAAYLLYGLVAQLIDPEAGLTAALMFIAMPDVGHVAYQARPYALSMAIVLASILYFWRWLEKGRPSDGLFCTVFLAAAFYTHPTCGLLGLVYALVIVCEALRWRTPAWKHIGAGAALLAGLCLPILPYYRSATDLVSTYSFAATPRWYQLFGFFPGIGGAVLAGGVALLYLIFRGLEWRALPVARRFWLLVITWLLVPPAMLWLVANLTPAKLFVPKYYAYAVPASAVVFAIVVRSVKQSRPRITLVSVAALSLVFATWPTTLWPPSVADWRETANIMRQQAYAPNTPIFVKFGFIETKSVQWMSDEAHQRGILAPFLMYPIPGTLVALPDQPAADFDDYMERAVRGLASRDEFFVVVNEDKDKGESWQQWFRARYASTFKAQRLSSRRSGPITRFRRIQSADMEESQ
jgi:mannosyltransferase